MIGNELTKSLGQPIVVEAKVGAGGNLASDLVAKAPPDGYTLLLMTGGHTASGALYKTLPFEPAESFEMISTITQFPFLFAVRADSPHQSLRSLIDAARAKPESVAAAKAGKLRVIGTSSGTRWQGMPEVPTADEAGVRGFDVRSWIGIAAPAGTPRAIIERLHAEVQKALLLPEVRARLEALGGEAKGSTPQEMKERIVFEVTRWKKVIADANIAQQ